MSRRQRSNKPMSEINVTPFVDVMMVLLIIFMVAAPLMTVGVPVELPKTAANALPTDEEEPLTVTITAEGFLLIQNINLLNYRAASAQMLAIAVVVASMDYLSSEMRKRVV